MLPVESIACVPQPFSVGLCSIFSGKPAILARYFSASNSDKIRRRREFRVSRLPPRLEAGESDAARFRFVGQVLFPLFGG